MFVSLSILSAELCPQPILVHWNGYRCKNFRRIFIWCHWKHDLWCELTRTSTSGVRQVCESKLNSVWNWRRPFTDIGIIDVYVGRLHDAIFYIGKHLSSIRCYFVFFRIVSTAILISFSKISLIILKKIIQQIIFYNLFSIKFWL